MNITDHVDTNNKTQSDYRTGAIDIQSVDPEECFRLGRMFERLIAAGCHAVTGECGQGIFIRIPLTPTDSWKDEVRPILEESNRYVDAIKRCRELTGMSLKDAKDAVDRMREEM